MGVREGKELNAVVESKWFLSSSWTEFLEYFVFVVRLFHFHLSLEQVSASLNSKQFSFWIVALLIK